MPHVYDTLHQACAALGIRLFTVTVQDLKRGVARRAYTSHPVEYPVSGTKPLTRDGWYDFCITGQQTFVANTTPGSISPTTRNELMPNSPHNARAVSPPVARMRRRPVADTVARAAFTIAPNAT